MFKEIISATQIYHVTLQHTPMLLYTVYYFDEVNSSISQVNSQVKYSFNRFEFCQTLSVQNINTCVSQMKQRNNGFLGTKTSNKLKWLLFFSFLYLYHVLTMYIHSLCTFYHIVHSPFMSMFCILILGDENRKQMSYCYSNLKV